MRTSVNLRLLDVPRIAEACDKSGLGHSELISRCLRKLFDSFPARLRTSYIRRLVQYQPDGVGYQIVNIDFDVEVYNLCVNFRVFSRVSVSMMVTIALALFLEKVVEEVYQGVFDSHNYVTYIHDIRHNLPSNNYEWLISWQITPIISTQKQLPEKTKVKTDCTDST